MRKVIASSDPAALHELYEVVFNEDADCQAHAELLPIQARALEQSYESVVPPIGTTETHQPDILERRGNRHGVISNKWKNRLRKIVLKRGRAVIFGREEINNDAGLRLSPAQILRQCLPYVSAGYLIEMSPGRYKFTSSGLNKIELADASELGRSKA